MIRRCERGRGRVGMVWGGRGKGGKKGKGVGG